MSEQMETTSNIFKLEGLLLVISAPSGTGKTSLCKAIEKLFPHVEHSVSYTTRPPREGEIDGKDYYFVSEKEFNDMVKNGMFLEHAVVHDFKYGTSRQKTEDKLKDGIYLILDIDTQGAGQLMCSFEGGIYIFLLPPSLEILEERLRKRGKDGEEIIQKRLENAKREISFYKKYDYVIVNDNFQKALQAIEAVIIAERNRVKRLNSDWIDEQFLS